MSEGNGKDQKKRFSKKIKTLEIEIEEDNGDIRVYTLRQLTGQQVSDFEKFRAPLMVDGKPVDGAADAMMDEVLKMAMYDPANVPVTQEFVNGLSLEAKVGLSNEAITLAGIKDVTKEKEEAKNA